MAWPLSVISSLSSSFCLDSLGPKWLCIPVTWAGARESRYQGCHCYAVPKVSPNVTMYYSASYHWDKTPTVHNLEEKVFIFADSLKGFSTSLGGCRQTPHSGRGWRSKLFNSWHPRSREQRSREGPGSRYSSQDHAAKPYPNTQKCACQSPGCPLVHPVCS